MSAPKTVALIGGRGYIGSVLHPFLKECGYLVQLIDRNTDLAERDEMWRSPDVVVYLGGSKNRPGPYTKADVIGEEAGIEKALSIPTGKFIYASTCAVYPNGYAWSEATVPEPQCDYGRMKLLGEGRVLAQDGTVVRCGAVCGVSPKTRWDLAVNCMTRDAVRDHRIDVVNMNSMRSHCHIADAVRAYEFLIGQPGGVYNIARERLNMVDLAHRVAEYVGTVQLKIFCSKSRSYCVSSEKIQDCGFEFRSTVDEAIKELATYVRSRYL